MSVSKEIVCDECGKREPSGKGKNREKCLDEGLKRTFCSEESWSQFEADYTLTQIAGRAFAIKEKSGLSFRQIAKKMGLSSTSQVQRIVDEAEPHNAKLSTLVKFGLACGHSVDVTFRPMGEFAELTKEIIK